jgi:hypothetical protein
MVVRLTLLAFSAFSVFSASSPVRAAESDVEAMGFQTDAYDVDRASSCLSYVDPSRSYVILTDDLKADSSGTVLATACKTLLFEMIQTNALNTIGGKEVPAELVAAFTASERTQLMAELMNLPNLDKFTLTLSQGRKSPTQIEVTIRVERKR